MLQGRSRRNARRIVVRDNHISVAELPLAFENFTILHITHLHLDIAPNFPRVLGDAVRALKYDLCVLTGDYRAETFAPPPGGAGRACRGACTTRGRSLWRAG